MDNFAIELNADELSMLRTALFTRIELSQDAERDAGMPGVFEADIAAHQALQRRLAELVGA